MKCSIIFACIIGLALAQFPPQNAVLRENKHLTELNQPHLPKDTNVLHATQQFLAKFAELKALADAAPDPVDQQMVVSRPRNVQPQPAPHRFSAPVRPAAPGQHAPAAPAAPRPTATGVQFDLNAEIGRLIQEHQRQHPTPPTPAAPRRTHVSVQPMQVVPVQFQPRQPQHQPRQPQHQPRQPQHQPQQPQHQPQAVRQAPSAHNPNIAITNNQGLVINPKQFPGPLAHSVPAGVGMPVSPTGFTAEVEAARQSLVQAHRNILAQQASLSRPQQ